MPQVHSGGHALRTTVTSSVVPLPYHLHNLMDKEQMQQQLLDCMLDLFAAAAWVDYQLTNHMMEDHLYTNTCHHHQNFAE